MQVFLVLMFLLGMFIAIGVGMEDRREQRRKMTLPEYLAARDRAQALFVRLLDPKQREQYQAFGYVDVPLPNGQSARIGPAYRIGWPRDAIGRAYPKSASQCVVPSGEDIPAADILIAQLLHLRNDPNRLRRIGGLKPLPPNPTVRG
jgi:hypothetical protein